MDYAAQIAEKKRKIEEIRRQMNQPQAIPKTEQLVQSVSQLVKNNQSESPVKQIQQEQKIGDPAPKKGNLVGLYLDQKRKKLGSCQVDIFENFVKPKQQIEHFEFGIQCDLAGQILDQAKFNDNLDQDESLVLQRKMTKVKKLDNQQMSSEKSAQDKPTQKKEKDNLYLTAEETNSIVKSQNFTNFFNKTSKIIEKSINLREIDGLETFMLHETTNKDDDLDILTKQMTLSDSIYTSNRVVTALQWSSDLPETFLAAYSQHEESNVNDQVGVVLIWSLQLKSRPEFYCFSSSPVTSAVFHPFQPQIIIGGLYNGQVVLWDLRLKQTPEKRTTLNSGGHSYPIFGLSVVGSQNAHNVVSVSNDGRLCLWNLSMLNQPQKQVDLKVKSKQPQATNVEVNVTTLAFPKDDANNYYVGAEDGSIYSQQLHPNQVQSEGQYVSFEDHQAPITAISLNSPSQQGSPLLHNMLLSSSFDWTAKLWNPRLQKDQCLMTFESAEDYIYDVQWNGNHPSLFSTVDGEGYVDLWDISKDQEAPITHYKSGFNSLNKQSWSQDGQRLSIGDSKGNVHILSLDKRALKVDNNRISSLEQIIKQKK